MDDVYDLDHLDHFSHTSERSEALSEATAASGPSDIEQRWGLKVQTQSAYSYYHVEQLKVSGVLVAAGAADPAVLPQNEAAIALYRYAVVGDPTLGPGGTPLADPTPGDLVVGMLPVRGACTDSRIDVVETPDAVILLRVAGASGDGAYPPDPVTGLPPAHPACSTSEYTPPSSIDITTVHLTEPLGTRTVIDAATGAPLPTVTP